ncbi:MAG: hypothetical protein PHY31_05120 [Smithellaceae bacterium]|nr:hypothetical protein [Smithellaceae bacterium]
MAPDLKIAPADVRPLKVAVIIQDPMPYVFFYKGEGSYSRDCTAEGRDGGMMVERDVSKLASDTLAQVFRQVVILRELPPPGQYDAVVEINIGQILLKEKVVITGETCNLTVDWRMTVLDSQNREIAEKRGVSPAYNFRFSIITPSKDIILGMNKYMPAIFKGIATEWANILAKVEIPAGGAR